VRRPSRFSRFRASHVFRILRVRTFRVFTHVTFPHISRFQHILHFSRFRASRVSAHFAFPRISRFRASRVFHILTFFTLQHALPRASLGSIAFRLHVLSSSSKVHWCVSHLVSLALYHICPCIPIYVHLSHYVFILHHPCMFSTTYLAPRPRNSLSMLTRQCIERGFYFTTLPSLEQLVRRT